ncbi:Cyclin-dependent kinase 1 [Strongyloides ratti]|uniref:Cyclin-dependent kinase 1 n=1 Tax=Strongyloides ratti TaxID=34506 RepID=A0A090LEM0_STRRB|nr:Cyclin-dependent kinase 1 [Strongyloides ratti]CEF65985.1 Cyclin-dependent kinase 1 [Strongyloides ratti]
MIKKLHNINNFQVLKKIGSGTFSTVYKVKEITTGRFLAVKKIWTSSDPKCRDFMHEVNTLLRLKSKYIIEIKYFSIRFKRLYIFTSLHKDNLATLLNIHKKIEYYLPTNVIQYIMLQLISGVRYCHRKNIIHRDIKPENIVIDKDFKLRLADFGSSLDIRKKPIDNIKFATTYEYAAPEIGFNIGMDLFSQDVWSIGCVFAELLTNKQLFCMKDSSELRFISIYKVVGIPTEDQKIMNILKFYKMDLNTKPLITIEKLCGLEEESKEINLLKSFLNPNYMLRINLHDAINHKFFS